MAERTEGYTPETGTVTTVPSDHELIRASILEVMAEGESSPEDIAQAVQDRTGFDGSIHIYGLGMLSRGEIGRSANGLRLTEAGEARLQQFCDERGASRHN